MHNGGLLNDRQNLGEMTTSTTTRRSKPKHSDDADLFFNSPEWKAWSKCAKPEGVVWDRWQEMHAKRQRHLARLVKSCLMLMRMDDAGASPVIGDTARFISQRIGPDISTPNDLVARARALMAGGVDDVA
jgi:hypothetical protein